MGSSDSGPAEIDRLCDDFERALRAEPETRLEEFLLLAPATHRQQAFHELLKVELELRSQRGDLPTQAEYLARFDQHTQAVENAFFSIDRRLADTALHGPFVVSRGLHVRCPHCHNPIELVSDAELESISCPSCGSDFSLVTDADSTKAASPITQVGEFRLIERVGLGAFGAVWKARDTRLDRTVAVKIPRRGQFDADQERDFLKEAQNAAQLSHPNIVPVYAVGRDGDTLYIVSEFIRGVTLADWLTAARPTFREAVELCDTVAGALEHAHEKGVVHRDLKPGNIMLDDNLTPHLMDFGLAKRDAGEIAMSVTGQILGTPAYMSPEQAEGNAKNADRRSDVYSLGVILFQLLTGELPFRGSTSMLLHQVIHDEPPSLRKFNASIPRDLETICLKCLEKDPDKRFDSAAEFRDELQRWSNGQPIHSRPIGPVAKGWRWCCRNRTVALLLTAIVATLVGATAISGQFAIQAGRAKKNATASAKDAQQAQSTAEDNQREALWNLYVASQYPIADAWRRRDFGHLEFMLEELVPEEGLPDFRGWEWAFYRDQCDRVATTVAGRHPAWHPKRRELAFIRGNRIMAVSPDDYSLVREIAKLSATGSLGNTTGLCWSSDGTRLAAGTELGVAMVFEADTGKEVFHRCVHEEFRDSSKWPQPPDDDQYVPVRKFDLSSDGRQLVTTNFFGLIQLWDVDKRELSKVIYRPEEERENVDCVKFSPGNDQIAVPLRFGRRFTWDLATNTAFDYERVCEKDGQIAWNPGGTKFAATPRLAIYQLGHEQAIARSETQDTRVVAWAGDSKLLVANDKHLISLMDAETLKVLEVFRIHRRPVESLSVSSDNRFFAAESVGVIKIVELLDPATGVVRLPAPARVDDYFTTLAHRLHWSPDGRFIASVFTQLSVADYYTPRIQVWDAEKTHLVTSEDSPDCCIGVCSWLPDSLRLQFVSDDFSLREMDVHTVGTKVQPLPREIGASSVGILVPTVGVSPDGRWLASGDGSRCVLVDLTTGNIAKSSRTNCVPRCSCWDDSSRRWAWANWGDINIWNPFTGKVMFGPKFSTEIRDMDWDKDGVSIALGTAGGEALLYSSEDFELLRSFEGHSGGVEGIAISPDSRRLATASQDSSVRVWDFATGRELLKLDHPDGLEFFAVRWSPNGQRLAAGDSAGEIFIWGTDSMVIPNSTVAGTP